MAKELHRFSDAQLRQWLKEGTPIHGRSDGGGLVFTLTKGGCASWVFVYRFGGRQKEITIGNYPDIKLADARKRAEELRVAVNDGNDVAATKQAAKQKSKIKVQSVADLCEYFLTEVVRPKFKHPQIPEARINNHIIPTIGKIRITEVTWPCSACGRASRNFTLALAGRTNREHENDCDEQARRGS